MSDDDKKKASDTPNAPLKNPKVDVNVKPVQKDLPKRSDPNREKVEAENQENKDLARKVERHLADKVRETVKDNESGGKSGQLDAAKKAGDDAAKAVPAHKIKEIKVDVGGKETTHKPSEGKPPEKK